MTIRPLFALFVFAFALLTGNVTYAQADPVYDPGVKPHKGIDEIYRKFSKAYDDLDAKAVADLYTGNAAYLSPGSEIRIGNDRILESFTRSFESVKNRKERRSIRFRIFQREVVGDLGYDVGIYTLTATGSDGESRTDRGKYVVVTKKGSDGKWRFAVDGYSGLPD